MTTAGKYEVAPDVMAAHLEGEAILLHLGRHRYFRLNRTGAHIFKAIEAKRSVDEIARSLVDTFEVTQEEAEAALSELMDELVENTLVRVVTGDA